jgi:hypothetical protein
MPIIRGAVTILSVLLFVIARPSSAQGNGANDDKSCDNAAKIVSKGHPEKQAMWALGQLTACGSAGASALVTGMSQYAADTDTLVLESFFSAVDNWRDAMIMNSALSLAGNPSASGAPAPVRNAAACAQW